MNKKEARERVEELSTEGDMGIKSFLLMWLGIPFLTVSNTMEKIYSGWWGTKAGIGSILIILFLLTVPVVNLFVGAYFLLTFTVALSEKFYESKNNDRAESIFTQILTERWDDPDRVELCHHTDKLPPDLDEVLVVINDSKMEVHKLDRNYAFQITWKLHWGKLKKIKSKKVKEVNLTETNIVYEDQVTSHYYTIAFSTGQKDENYLLFGRDRKEDYEDFKQFLTRQHNNTLVEELHTPLRTEELEVDTDSLEKYISNFVEKHQRGNKDQRRKLRELIKREEGVELETSKLGYLIDRKVNHLQKRVFDKLMESHNPEAEEGKIEAYVEEFGKGNELLISFLACETNNSPIDARKKVEQKFDQIRRSKEIERFGEDIGVKTKKKSDKSNAQLNEVEADILQGLQEGDLDWDYVENLGGIEFEYFIADLFEEMGYETKVTQGSGDQGADVIAEKEYETVVIQAKRYTDNVSNKGVQEVISAKDYYNADKGMVVTTSGYTQSAKELAQSSGIELWDRQKVREQMRKYMTSTSV